MGSEVPQTQLLRGRFGGGAPFPALDSAGCLFDAGQLFEISVVSVNVVLLDELMVIRHTF